MPAAFPLGHGSGSRPSSVRCAGRRRKLTRHLLHASAVTTRGRPRRAFGRGRFANTLGAGRATPAGFQGGLNAEKYVKMTGISKPTATRDLADLVRRELLWTRGEGKATRYYLNVPGWTHGVPASA
jgi:hypothetical protein